VVTQFTSTQTCPVGCNNGGTMEYFISGSTLTIFSTSNDGGVSIDLYMKR